MKVPIEIKLASASRSMLLPCKSQSYMIPYDPHTQTTQNRKSCLISFELCLASSIGGRQGGMDELDDAL